MSTSFNSTLSHQDATSSLETSFTNAKQNDVLWIKNCSSPLDNVNFQDARVIGSLLPLGLVCLMVIFGNIMVITAVKITHKLRGATNLFIVSLAWADLMLGIIVLPFSAMYEVFKMWLFGQVWCSIWLAVDVWMCTASILHLVVISLDRYIAVTHPITYPNLMTSKKAKLLIAGAWILSFVICFPPLVGWNDKDEEAHLAEFEFDLNKTAAYENTDEVRSILKRCNPQCTLNSEPGYVIYSAVGSFYAPMLVMMFFNWRIYRTATKTTKAIRQGWTRVKGVSGDEEIGLGIHRGGGGGAQQQTKIRSNGSARSAYAPSNNSTLSSRRTSSCHNRNYIGNGHNGNKAANDQVSSICNRSPNPLSSPKLRRANLTLPPSQASSSSHNNAVVSNSNSDTLNSSTNVSMVHHHNVFMPRSKSSQLISSRLEPPRSPSHHSYLNSTNHSSHQSRTCRSKSAVNVRLQKPEQQHQLQHHQYPRVSHHQPCPNHVAGKTFAEMGTQTLPRPKKKVEEPTPEDEENKGCVASLKQRLGLQKSTSLSEPETSSIGSGHQIKPTSCFRCHPRRWRHQAGCCLKRSTGPKNTGVTNKQKSSFHARMQRSQSADNDSDPGSILGTSTHELQVIPLGGVASMISSVVNQSASMAASTAGGKVPQARSTFGKRNIKNQVRRFRMETKAAKTLGIIVGCFICCWFPFFTMYLVTAFCDDCIPKMAFSIIFWLGYCNSAINPFIYAAFSRDFRGAFKKIICKMLCRRPAQDPPRGIFMALHPRNVGLGPAAVSLHSVAQQSQNRSIGGP